VSAFRVKFGANDLNCVDVPLNRTRSLTHLVQWLTAACAVLYSSNEPGELLQWFCYDDSIINVVTMMMMMIIIIIIILGPQTQSL